MKKDIAPLKIKKICLFVFSSFMPNDLFCEGSITIQYILGNKIKVTILISIYATGFGFINKKFMGIICKILRYNSNIWQNQSKYKDLIV